MSAPTKSPASKTPSKKKKGNMNPLMLPGLDKLPKKKGGKPVVVVVVKGGKNPPNLSNLPFLMGGKMKRKKASKKKKSNSNNKTTSQDKKKTNKAGEDDSDLSESDRVSAPDIPKAHKQKKTASVRSDKSVTGVISSSTSTTSIASARSSRTPQLNASTPKKATLPKTSNDVIIQGGIVDRPCVPMFMLIDGPAGCPIVVPLDARDESGLVPEGSAQPLRVAPSEDTKGFMIVEDGLLQFKPLKEYPQPPPCSTPGTLVKFLSNSNIFIADSGPKLPDQKPINTAPSATIQEKIGVKLAVSGHIAIVAEKGTCHFTRVAAPTKQPFYPENAAMGVLVKDRSNSYLFWIPTENRFVGPLLSKNAKNPVKPSKEMAIMGYVYKDSLGIMTFEAKSSKLENLIGFIMSSATGVPIYAAKPEATPTTRPKTTPAPSVHIPAPSIPIPAPAPAAAQEPVQPVPPLSPPPQRDEISPPPVSSPSPTPVAAAAPAAPSPPAAPVASGPSAPSTPSLGWSMLSALGSVLTTTASVISNTAGAVTEAASGAGASLPPPTQSPPTTPSPVIASPPPPAPPTVAVVAAPKTAKSLPSVPSATAVSEEEAALAAEEAAADASSTGGRVADTASTGGKGGVTINITVRDSNSNGGKIADQKSEGETCSDALSDGIGDQMAGIYRDLLSSQNELPPEKEEESKNEEKVEKNARSSPSEENRRKAETSKEYKKYMEDRSVAFSPYGYR